MAGDLKRGMGSIEKNGNRYWWNVRLPGERERQRIPLIPDGAEKPTDDYAVAIEIAKRRFQQAVFVARSKESTGNDNTIAGLVRDYMEYAKGYYRHDDGTPTSEVRNVEDALEHLVEACPTLPAEDFGPKKAKQIRQSMIDSGRLCRDQINKRVKTWARMFKWAAENERVSSARWMDLKAIAPLKRGRTTAKDHPPVEPVDPAHVRAIFPFCHPQIQAMLELQMHTGMRPGEVTAMRLCDIDMVTCKARGVWVYKPSQHKTKHHGKVREIHLGPQAQGILAPFLVGRKTDAYLFSPAEADQWRRARQSEARVTPMNEGNKPGTNRKEDPKKKPGDHYDTNTYGKAVTATTDKANKPRVKANAEREAKGEKPEPLIPHFHPHQIRHTFGTEVRDTASPDHAQAALGHSNMDMTEHYARVKREKAIEVALRFG